MNIISSVSSIWWRGRRPSTESVVKARLIMQMHYLGSEVALSVAKTYLIIQYVTLEMQPSVNESHIKSSITLLNCSLFLHISYHCHYNLSHL